MSAYVIGYVLITDPDAFPDYMKLSGPAIAKYGGRFIAPGGHHETLEGTMEADRVVIIEFDTMDQAKTWWTSPEYDAAKPFRRRASTGDFVLAEGAL